MNDLEIKKLAALYGINEAELRALIARGLQLTSDLRHRRAMLEAFMGRDLSADKSLRTVNKDKESADAYNKKVRDYNQHMKEQSSRVDLRRKARELQLINDMVAAIHSGTDKAARIATPIMMTAATAGLAPTYGAVANEIPGALNYLRSGWNIWNATHPVASMVLNGTGTGLAIGLLADPETGVLKTINAVLDGRYADAALSGMGDLWNGYVAANGLSNFVNLAGSLLRQVPNITDVANIPGDAVIFDPRKPFGLPYAAKAYGIPEMLPESKIPGAGGSVRVTYKAPMRQTGLNGYDGQFLWRGTTLPKALTITINSPKGQFVSKATLAEEVIPVLPYGSTLLPVPGIVSTPVTHHLPEGPWVPPMLPPAVPLPAVKKWSVQQSWGSPAYLEYFRNLPEDLKRYGNGSVVNVLHVGNGLPTVRSAGYGVWDPSMEAGYVTTLGEMPNYVIDASDKKNWNDVEYKGYKELK